MEKIFYKNMSIYVLHRSDELDHEQGRPALLIKYRTKISLIWAGTHKLDLKSKENPLIINLGKNKTYFYSSGIEKVETQYLKFAWVNFKTYNAYELSSKEQQQLISKFVSFTLENDPYLEIKNLKQEIKQLKNEIELLKQSNLKNRNWG